MKLDDDVVNAIIDRQREIEADLDEIDFLKERIESAVSFIVDVVTEKDYGEA